MKEMSIMIAVLSLTTDASHPFKSVSKPMNATGIRSGYKVFSLRSNKFARKFTGNNKI